MASMASMASICNKSETRHWAKGQHGNLKSWGYEAAQLTQRLKTTDFSLQSTSKAKLF